MQKVKGYFPSIFLGVCIVVAVFFLYKSFFKKPSVSKVQQTVVPTEAVPTKESEKFEINITDSEIKPAILEVKPNDSIILYNKTSQEISIKAEGGGGEGLPLSADGMITMSYTAPGNFKYEVLGLETSLKGEIIVR